MVTIVNSFVLPDDVINKMKTKIQETKEKEIELGFGLCRLPTNVIKTGEECVGDRCTMLPKGICKIGSYVGEFHTHPMAGASPSIADLLHAYKNDIICVGSVPEDKIKCYLRAEPRDINTQKKLEREDAIEEEKLARKRTIGDVLEWIGARNALMKRYFKTIDVK